MSRRSILSVLLAFILLVTQVGCWSSKEVEELSIYTGLSLDKGELSPLEQELEKKGSRYFKKNKITASVQIVPKKSSGGPSQQGGGGGQEPNYNNITGTGDSLLEIFRQLSLRLDRPVIGHHLKVMVVSTELAKQQTMQQLMDFVLRDNDIRPSCLVFLSKGRAANTLVTKYKEEVPSIHILYMLRNHFRTSKVMRGVNLSELDGMMHSKKSYILQNIIESDGELEFSGAGIIKGETGHWIGTLGQQDVESIGWIKGDVEGGAVKTYDKRNEAITYEIKSVKSKITTKVADGDDISFHVKIESKGRLIENWDEKVDPTETRNMKEAELEFEKQVTRRVKSLMHKLQSEYKVDVAGFGDHLKIEKPQVWKKVKDDWDYKFSKIPVTFDVKLTITDLGSSAE
ncbi:Ger(x)C family spore germination protein [Paenibacillus polymyxa]|uniref:Ger(x)C family spore germination protein n=1 Tax=Paenibacillus TaxID=44249 RepID=UPI000C9F5D1B|nr:MULTISPECIES: Ger(x)C family spore germination protein [Paenibacillus]AUS24874.1 spore germination protein gerac [Paenibacillus polymyxa]KAF6652900.1 Ger(x)C family spore germination protein [Paenibacillus sp. EKM301P]UBS87896.1 Ger(x)C family spore germination protein [Paenibacillus polymyxa]WHX36487.1 Ger(x)C family spore germination protein [Paenibacillus polymyxa]